MTAYLAEATRAQVVSAGDSTFLQRRGGAGEGGEADYKGGDGGGEVDHFLIVEGKTVENFFVAAVTCKGLWLMILRAVQHLVGRETIYTCIYLSWRDLI